MKFWRELKRIPHKYGHIRVGFFLVTPSPTSVPLFSPHTTAVTGTDNFGPLVILEAGRKFSFVIEKLEVFAVSVEYLQFPVISKLG